MIHDVDASLRAMLRADVLDRAEVELVFDAPTSSWASRRTAPTLDVYLYDIREDTRLRSNGSIADLSDPAARGYRSPPRWFKLSYLVTAWTQRPEDEHRLLSSVLACLLGSDAVPPDRLQGQLREQNQPVMVAVAVPPPQDRSLSDIWSALGGELKPSLDLCITAAFDTSRLRPAGPPVREAPRLRFRAGTHGGTEAPDPPGVPVTWGPVLDPERRGGPS